MEITTPAFFCFPFAWNIFFHPLTFRLYVSWDLKWVYCRQHIYIGLVFWIHSASLCLLVGVFNPFTFKVILDIYVSLAIFLIVWEWFCRYFFFCRSFVFLDYISPFNTYCIASWWYWILLTFACLKSFLFLHQFCISLPGTVILVVDFPLSVL